MALKKSAVPTKHQQQVSIQQMLTVQFQAKQLQRVKCQHVAKAISLMVNQLVAQKQVQLQQARLHHLHLLAKQVAVLQNN